MGDVLHALPAVAAMQRSHPDWRIDWVVDKRWRDLLVVAESGSGPVVDQVIPVRTRAWNKKPFSFGTLRDVLGLRRRLRAEGYDLCVDLQGTLRSAVIGWMAGARRFVGPKEPREGPAMRLYGETVGTLAMHVIDQAGEILGHAVGKIEPLTGDRRLGIIPHASEDERWVDGVIAGLGGVRGIVVIAPTSGWRSKEWPPERFGELAGRLAEGGWGVLVNAPPGAGANSGFPSGMTDRGATAGSVETVKEAVAEVVVRASGGRAVVVPCSIAQLAALLRTARLLVAGDTGPMHLADALGVPVVALFGPTDPGRTGPVGARALVLRDPSSVTDHRRYAVTEAGLGRITVEEVYRAAVGVLGE